MKKFWKEYAYSDYITSAVTMTEYLTVPCQKYNEKQLNSFYTFVDGMETEIREVNKAIAEKAAWIRAEYIFLRRWMFYSLRLHVCLDAIFSDES